MPITLTVAADSVPEFDELLARFAPSRGGVMPELAVTATEVRAGAAAQEAEIKATRTRAAKVKAEEPEHAPTSGPEAEQVSAAPAATASDSAAALADDEGEVTVQMLKEALSDLLKVKSASLATQTLLEASGCKSLSSGSPSVTEKAQTDPTIMRVTLDALRAATAAP